LRHSDFLGEPILGNPHRFQKFLQQDFPRGRVRYIALFSLFAVAHLPLREKCTGPPGISSWKTASLPNYDKQFF
jgi:hypothetical protein